MPDLWIDQTSAHTPEPWKRAADFFDQHRAAPAPTIVTLVLKGKDYAAHKADGDFYLITNQAPTDPRPIRWDCEPCARAGHHDYAYMSLWRDGKE